MVVIDGTVHSQRRQTQAEIVLKYFVSWSVNPALKQYPVFRILSHRTAGAKPPQIMPWITTISAKCAADNNTPLLYKGRNTRLRSETREVAGTIKFPVKKPIDTANWKNWKMTGNK